MRRRRIEPEELGELLSLSAKSTVTAAAGASNRRSTNLHGRLLGIMKRRHPLLSIALLAALACSTPEERAEQAREAMRLALEQGNRADALRAVDRLRESLPDTPEAVIEVGNLDAIREFNDVEDIVAGHVAALENGMPGRVYNLCSGQGHTIREILALLIEVSGVKAEVRQQAGRLRAADVPALVGDPTRAREELQWKTRIPLEESVSRLLARWGARGTAAVSRY